MIEVYHTVIDETQLIGVGPLYVKRRADPIQVQLYNEREFHFEIYIKGGGRVAITTDWLPGTPPDVENSRLAQSAITEAHKAVRQCLISGCFTSMLIVTSYPDELAEPEKPFNEGPPG